MICRICDAKIKSPTAYSKRLGLCLKCYKIDKQAGKEFAKILARN
jgi:hypothetical protein